MPDWCQQRVPNSGLEVTSSKNIGLNIGAIFLRIYMYSCIEKMVK